ncbi:MAG TPA: ATP-binding protein [Candidatus Dormibacteraeota bacterium]|nr:ATP-binding protein [Candidatus Dormibacteraeota bacterium]
MAPVRYSPRLVAEVGSLAALSVAIGVVLHPVSLDWATLVVGSVCVLILALFSVRSVFSVQWSWTASVLVQLGLALTLGATGAAAGAIAEAIGVMVRTRNGWFRTLFNAADNFLASVAAYEAFLHVVPLLGSNAFAAPVGGLAAGVAHFVVNNLLLGTVAHTDDSSVSALAVMRQHAQVAPYAIGFGWSSFGFVVLHDNAGFVGFTALLAPVLVLQAGFVVFSRRISEYERQRAVHQEERESLLHKAVEASETERRRIARDLHDGVVQNLGGMAFAMTATSARLRGEGNGGLTGDQKELLELLDSSAEETRKAMKDLRTLIIEIAPPTLRREGLHAALLEILQTLEQAGTKTRLELPSNMRLRQDRASLIFRVAQEVLRNVAAHAEATSVSVVLREQGGMAVLRVEDNGKGFTEEDVARRRARGHVGTNAIVELAEEAGGSLAIDSAPGKGTRVVLKLPVE